MNFEESTFIQSAHFFFCSFSEDTLVETEDGNKAISEVEEGEYVLAYNEETGETGYYEVTDVWAHDDPVIVYLVIDGELVETTPEHPFYTEEGEWIPAGELEIGDEIVSSDGDTGTVESVEFIAENQTMYNFTVDEAHTYFVGEGEWLVHNSCPIGFNSETWNFFQQRASQFVRTLDTRLGNRFNLTQGELLVQGSRVSGTSDKTGLPVDVVNADLDLLLRVDDATFDALSSDFFNHVHTPTPEQIRYIDRGYMNMHVLSAHDWGLNYPSLFYNDFYHSLGLDFQVQFSISKIGSYIDTPPYLSINLD